MTTLFAQPYDITATGFYFDSFESYESKASTLRNEHGDPVEEYEIQYIDGEDIDSDLSKAFELNQINIEAFFTAVDDWDDHQKIIFIIAVGECGCQFDVQSDHPDQLDVDLFELDSMKELAEHFVDEGLYGEIPQALQFYIDTDAMARDLEVDYSETIVAGTRYVFRCA